METIFGVLNSDAVNRNNMVFPASTLMDALNQRWLEGIPVNIGHDFHRPLGWGRPFGIYLESELTRLLGLTFIPGNESEYDFISNARGNYLEKYLYESCKDYFEELDKNFKDLIIGEYKYIHCGCPAIINNGIVERMYKELFAKKDKHGLIYLNEILDEFEIVYPGYFKNKKSEVVIYCHEFFRKSLSRINNFNNEFLTTLLSLKENKDLNIRIKLDSDLVGLYTEFRTPIELEYWYGPKYDDNIEDIPVGVTVHVSEDKDYEKVFHQISKTEFWLKKDEHTRVFEIEELKNHYSFGTGENIYSDRYTHAIYNLEKKEFDHFDGAIKIYNDEEMINRIEVPIDKAGKKATYTKLFRLDKKIEISLWKRLMSDYFRGNPHIIEYFEGEKENLETEVLESPIPKSIVLSKCPYKIDLPNDIKVLFTYHPIEEDRNFDRKVIAIDTLTIDTIVHQNVMQHEIIEVKKTLQRMGEDLLIPANPTFIALEDKYINFPLIQHGILNYPNNIIKTLQAYNLILESFASKNSNHILTISFSWFLKDRECRISLFGHHANLKKWFDNFINSFPLDETNISEWIQSNADFLKKSFSINKDQPYITDIVKTTGILWFKRNFVEYEYDLVSNKESNCVDIILKLPSNEKELVEVLENGDLNCSHAFLIKEIWCNKCQKSYHECSHSKFLDSDVYCIMKDVQMVFTYWTDKKA